VPTARLLVVGSLLEPIEALDLLAVTEGVDVRTGWLDDEDVARWAAAADVCLLPYAHGAHSAVLHQAAAAGTPVIASPPLREEVDRFEAGAVVELQPEKWAVAISAALSDEPLAAPRRIEGRDQVRATAAIYAELIARWSSAV
jgi:glycosyltransferase involved in cell wall biosynthesis